MISNDLLFHMLCEFGSTALMIVFGVGVHCDTVLKGTKYQGSGHMFAITTWSFGISVCLFVFGGAVCMNPAMVLAQCIVGLVPWASCIPYMVADMLGGFAGACIAWLMYADEFKASEGVVDPIAQRNIFSTNPRRRARTSLVTSSARPSAPSCSSPQFWPPRAAPARTSSCSLSAWASSCGPWAWAWVASRLCHEPGP